MRSKKGKARRFSREEWLARALEILAREGQSKLRIEQLVDHLGVTKGSFYWHFKDRDDFVTRLAEHWAGISTTQIVTDVEGVTGDARHRLRALMELHHKADVGKYDMAMRSWAAQDSQVARIVRRVDKQRAAFVRSLFMEMGFEGRELEVRVETFSVFQSLEMGFLVKKTKKERAALIEARHQFFTRK